MAQKHILSLHSTTEKAGPTKHRTGWHWTSTAIRCS